MVSSDNQLIGLVAIILGFFVATRGKTSMVESVFRPDILPMKPLENIEKINFMERLDQSIGFVRKRIGKLEASFRPTGPKRVTGFPRGVFVSSLAGKSVITGFGPKASPKTRAIIGDVSRSAFAVDVNRAQLLAFRDVLGELNILRTKSV